jgi:IS30 family transposase
LVEHHTRYVMLANVANKDTQTVVSALIEQAKTLPSELYRSLTWDRGKELTDHRRFTLTTNIDVYFCDPQSPWQRGSNENTNGLLRQYFPKGTDLSVHSQAYLNKVARQLNERPRETLQFETRQRDLTHVLRRPVGPAGVFRSRRCALNTTRMT